MNSRGRE
jgi:hypothetical protein